MKKIIFYLMMIISAYPFSSFAYYDDSIDKTMDSLYSDSERIERQIERQEKRLDDLEFQQQMSDLDALNRMRSR